MAEGISEDSTRRVRGEHVLCQSAKSIIHLGFVDILKNYQCPNVNSSLLVAAVASDVLQLDTTAAIAQEAASVERTDAKALVIVATYTSLLTYPRRGIKTVHQTATITVLPQTQS